MEQQANQISENPFQKFVNCNDFYITILEDEPKTIASNQFQVFLWNKNTTLKQQQQSCVKLYQKHDFGKKCLANSLSISLAILVFAS